MKTLLSTILLIIVLAFSTNAQAFLSPVESTDIMSPAFMKSVTVTKTNGEKVTAEKFGMAVLTNGAFASFVLKLDNDEKVKFKAEEVQEMKVQLNGFAKVMMAADEGGLVGAFLEYKFDNQSYDYVTFEQVELKPGKFKLMQLLNPSTDQFIKVYLDPNAQQTSGSGEDKSYFVKKGDRAFKLKKAAYKKEFPNLFGDSKAMMKMVSEKSIKPRFSDFAGHIGVYNQSLNW